MTYYQPSRIVDTVIGIRCARLAEREIELGKQLAQCFENVLFLLDPRASITAKQREAAGSIGNVIRIDPATCLPPAAVLPEDWAWRCGDLALYALHAHSQSLGRRIFFYWLIESDVALNLDARAFFNETAKRHEDFLAKHLRAARTSWRWHDPIQAHNLTPCRCDFPMVRLSEAALVACKSLRGRIQSSPVLDPEETPNDESLVASLLSQDGWDCQSLERIFPDRFLHYSTVRAFPDTPGFLARTRGSIIHSLRPMNEFISKNFLQKLAHVAPEDRSVFLRQRLHGMSHLLDAQEISHIQAALILRNVL